MKNVNFKYIQILILYQNSKTENIFNPKKLA